MFHSVQTIQSARIARFGRGAVIARSERGFDEAQLQSLAPSVFAEDKHTSRSARYTYIPTIEVLRGLAKEGFAPYEVRQGGTRDDEKRGFTKHLLRLRQEGAQVVDATHRELVLLNSHDGTSSYQLMAGLFRMVCSNGLVTADGDAHMVRIPHKGDIVGQVVDAAYTLVRDADQIDRRVADMRQIDLRPAEQEAFAEAAAELRWENGTAPITPRQINEPRRREDQGNSLWLAFNRAQENLTQGGQRYVQRNERGEPVARRETRPVQGIDGNTALNRALWVLGARMQELRSAA